MGPAKLAFVILVAAYPAIVYFGLANFDVRTVAVMLLVLGLLRFLLVRNGETSGAGRRQSALVIAGLLAVSCVVLATGSETVLRYYPVFVNAAFLTVFFGSLLYPPSVVERIARRSTPDLPEAGVRYTRKVTMVWCVFFVFNGGVALYTSLSTDLGAWAVYNGVISYAIMGLLFAGEYLIRMRMRFDDPAVSPPPERS